MKKTFLCVLVFAPVFVFSFAHDLMAQNSAPTASSTEQEVKDFYEAFPEIYIDDIGLPNTSYKAGDTVTGLFVIRNGKDFDVPNVSYDIVLAGKYADGIAGTFYEKVRQGPIYMKAGETRQIEFSYKLPEALNGENFGMQIQAVLQDGMTLGWKDFLIKVTGGKSALDTSSAHVTANNKAYPLQAGPTVKKNDPASVKITLENPSQEDISVAPVLIVKKFIVGGTPAETRGEAFTVNKKSSKEVSVPLNTSYDPAVYVGTVRFIDENGLSRAPAVEFRYIVGGDIMNFQSVSADKTVLKKGDNFNVSIIYSGAPIDIDNDSVGLSKNTVNFYVKILNEKNQTVAENTNPNFDFNAGNNVSLPLAAAYKSKALRAEISVSRNGAVLMQYNANLSSDYIEAQKESQKAESLKDKIILIALSVVALLAIGLIFKLLKKKNSAGMVAVLFAVISVFSMSHKAQAFTIESWSLSATRQGWSQIAIGVAQGAIVTGVTPSGYLAPGESFSPKGSIKYAACGNATKFRLKVAATYNGVRKVFQNDKNITYTTSNLKFPINDSFYFSDSFTASSVPGSTQRVDFVIETFAYQDGVWVPWVKMTGYQNFKIMPKPFPVISASPNPVTSGDSVNVTWSVPYNSANQLLNLGLTYCNATGDWSGQKAYSSTISTETKSNITSSKTYSIQCFKNFHGTSIASDVESVTVEVASNNGSAQITHVNSVDGSIVPVTFGATAQLDGSSANEKSGNSVFFSGVAPGSHTFGVKQEGYKLRAGTCIYPIGGTECFLTKAENYTMKPTCAANGFCSVPFNVFKGTVSKVAFLYGVPLSVDLAVNPDSFSSCDSTPSSASILTWVTSGATSCTATGFDTGGLLNNTTANVSTGPLSSSQEYTLSCSNLFGENVSDTARVTCGAPQTGSLEVRRVDADHKTFTSPETLAWYGTVTPVVSNGYTFTSVPTGSQTVSVSVPSNWGISGVATCNTSGCTPSSYSTDGLDCVSTSGVCKFTSSAVPLGGTAKVWFVYVPKPTVSLTATPVVATADPENGGTIDSCQITSLLKWTSENAYSCTGTGDGFNTGGLLNNTAGVSVGPISVVTPYTIECIGWGGKSSKTVSVTVPEDCGTASASGSLEIKRVKLAGTTYETLITPVTSAWYDSVAPIEKNSQTFTPVAIGSHTANASVPLGYKITGVATCNTTGCTPSSYTSNFTCVADGSSCSYSTAVSDDVLTRVWFLYEKKDLTANLSAIPSDTKVTFISTLTAELFGSLVARRSSQTASVLGALAENIIPFTYTFTCGNGTAANPTVYGPTIQTAVSSQCTYTTPGTYLARVNVVGGGNTAEGTATITAKPADDPTGAVEIYRIDQNGNTIPGTTAFLDRQSQNITTQNTNNASYFDSVTAGSGHTAGVLQDARTLRWAQCEFTTGGTECPVPSLSTGFSGTGITCSGTPTVICTVPATVTAGKTRKVIFMFSPAVSTASGDFLVRRVAVDSSGNSASIPSTSVTLNGTDSKSDNPAIWTGKSGSHTIAVSPISGYSTSVRLCQYTTPSSYIEANEPSCSSSYGASGVSSYTVEAIAGKTIKLEFKYAPNPDPATPTEDFGDEAECYTTSVISSSNPPQQYLGVPVEWRVSNTNLDLQYTWTDLQTNVKSIGTGLGTIKKVYTTTGNKSVSLYVTDGSNTAGPFICSVGVPGSADKALKIIIKPTTIIEI